MQLAAILLGLAALGGLTMAAIRLTGVPRPPDWFPPLHGLAAASGVLVLIYTAITRGIPGQAQLALGLFILAALGGLFMNLRFHRRQLPLPIPLMIGHGLVAASGLVLLVMCMDESVGAVAL